MPTIDSRHVEVELHTRDMVKRRGTVAVTAVHWSTGEEDPSPKDERAQTVWRPFFSSIFSNQSSIRCWAYTLTCSFIPRIYMVVIGWFTHAFVVGAAVWLQYMELFPGLGTNRSVQWLCIIFMCTVLRSYNKRTCWISQFCCSCSIDEIQYSEYTRTLFTYKKKTGAAVWHMRRKWWSVIMATSQFTRRVGQSVNQSRF